MSIIQVFYRSLRFHVTFRFYVFFTFSRHMRLLLAPFGSSTGFGTGFGKEERIWLGLDIQKPLLDDSEFRSMPTIDVPHLILLGSVISTIFAGEILNTWPKNQIIVCIPLLMVISPPWKRDWEFCRCEIYIFWRDGHLKETCSLKVHLRYHIYIYIYIHMGLWYIE